MTTTIRHLFRPHKSGGKSGVKARVASPFNLPPLCHWTFPSALIELRSTLASGAPVTVTPHCQFELITPAHFGCSVPPRVARSASHYTHYQIHRLHSRPLTNAPFFSTAHLYLTL